MSWNISIFKKKILQTNHDATTGITYIKIFSILYHYVCKHSILIQKHLLYQENSNIINNIYRFFKYKQDKKYKAQLYTHV